MVFRELGRGKRILDHVVDEACDLQDRPWKRAQEKYREHFESVSATEITSQLVSGGFHQTKFGVSSIQ